MKKTFIYAALFLVGAFNSLQAQSWRAGFSVNPGFSYLDRNSYIGSSYSYQPAFSGNAGLILEVAITPKLQVGMEALWVYLSDRGFSQSNLLPVPPGGSVNTTTHTYFTHSFGLPAYVRLGGRRFAVKAGFQALYSMYDGEKIVQSGTLPDQSPYHTKMTLYYDDYRNVDFGSKIGLDFGIGKRIQIRVDFYSQWTNFPSNNRIPFALINYSHYRQLTLGLAYFMHQQSW